MQDTYITFEKTIGDGNITSVQRLGTGVCQMCSSKTRVALLNTGNVSCRECLDIFLPETEPLYQHIYLRFDK